MAVRGAVWVVLAVVALGGSGAVAQVDCSASGLSGQGDCDEIFRAACDTQQGTPNVCGPCLPGYQGTAGFGNTACTPVSCGVPPTVTNALAETPSSPVAFGLAAPFQCAAGFALADGTKRFTVDCQADGTFAGPPACTDFDACASGPCGESDCVDEAPPSDGHQCKCKAGFSGTHAAGCIEVALESTDNGNLVASCNDLAVRNGQNKTVWVGQLPAQIQAARIAVEGQIAVSKAQTDSDITRLMDRVTALNTDLGADAAQLADLRTLVLELASNHSDLSADIANTSANHDVLSSSLTLLSTAIKNEETRALAAETANTMAISALRLQLQQDIASVKADITALSNVVVVQANCKEILLANPNSQSGSYNIKPPGFPELQVYCDMTTDGGGWTRVTHINEKTVRSPCREEATNMVTLAALDHRSFAGVWYSSQKPREMLIHAVTVGGSAYGEGHKLRIRWGNTPFSLYSYGASTAVERCENLNTGRVWPNCRYSSHSGTPWQQCAFSFTAGVGNGYSGNSNSRITLGPTSQPGTSCTWHNFGADTNSRNQANSWTGTTKRGYMYMR